MSQNILQLKPTLEAGCLVYASGYQHSSIAGKVDASSINTLQLGYPVKMVVNGTSQSSILVVDAITDATNKVYGVILKNESQNIYVAKDIISEIASAGSHVYMLAGGNIQTGDQVGWDITNKKVVTHIPNTTALIGIAHCNAVLNAVVHVEVTAPLAIA